MKNFLFIGISYLLTMGLASAQVFSNKEVGKKNEQVIDSIKMAEYPYALPIWGDKATGMGFNLPYSAGVSTQYFWQESDLVIDNLRIGFNNSEMYNMDEFVRFDKARATASAVTVRPDIWLFPFLNIYGILGKSQASTEVGFGIYLPDGDNNYSEVFSAGSLVEFQAQTFGLGMTPTIGIGGGFMALDMNVAWSDAPQLNAPTRTFIFGPRFGKNFNLRKPGTAVTVWVGGFRVNLSSATDGTMALSEVFEDGDFGGRIDAGFEKVGSAQNQLDSWWGGLSDMEQNNPVNKVKYEKGSAVLERATEILVAAEGALSTIASSTVNYSMDKRPADMWNFIVGGQYQFSKHFMLRAEYGFLGSREQFMSGIQYRFGL